MEIKTESFVEVKEPKNKRNRYTRYIEIIILNLKNKPIIL